MRMSIISARFLGTSAGVAGVLLGLMLAGAPLLRAESLHEIRSLSSSSRAEKTVGPAESHVADTLSAARRAYLAGRLYAAVRLYFAHWDDVPDLDLDEAFADYLEEAMVARDRKGFALATQAFLARLGNSHTMLYDRALFADAGSGHGFEARYLDGDWVVTATELPELAAGDVLRAIDGQPMQDFYREKSRYISASTERHRRRKLFEWRWVYLFPLQYTLELADGRRVTVDRHGEFERPKVVTEGRWLEDGRIAYIRIPSWDRPEFQERALELLHEYRSAQGLVVDVRGNSGGSSPIRFIRALMERPWRWWAESTPMQFALFSYFAEQGRSGFSDFARPHMAWPASVVEADSVFTGQLVILIDEACHSACEDFVMPFKDTGRAVLVGEFTAGSTGQPYSGDLGDGMNFVIGAKREYFPDGSRFESVGIEPDVRVLPTGEDLRAHRDVELKKALELLERSWN